MASGSEQWAGVNATRIRVTKAKKRGSSFKQYKIEGVPF